MREPSKSKQLESLIEAKDPELPKNMPPRPPLVFIKEDFRPFSVLFGKN
jgi:hypothetical protein